ncbi:MAG: hypothetical protein OEW16_06145 [Gammaproteobacteria bacterium]|nr:hypothetical protein [Gammaproteobacteria bacterium]
MALPVFVVLSAALAGCAAAPTTDEAAVRAEIQARINRCSEATRIQDIQAYMTCIPDDWPMKDEAGAVVGRDELKQNVLRDWSIIPRTLAIQTTVDSVEVHGSEATVYTSQRWERLMLERDEKTIDTVLTTQKHREIWRLISQGWMNYDVQELGGGIWVNGKPYNP